MEKEKLIMAFKKALKEVKDQRDIYVDLGTATITLKDSYIRITKPILNETTYQIKYKDIIEDIDEKIFVDLCNLVKDKKQYIQSCDKQVMIKNAEQEINDFLK